MFIEHRGSSPSIDPTAYVAPTAVVSGDVHVGAHARILFGAVLTAEDGRIDVGERCVVMENALIRGRASHHTSIDEDVLVGPHAHVNGATIGAGCFLATGAAVFPGAVLGPETEVRIHGVVHVNTRTDAGALVPIGWVAVGDPARILPASAHEEIWEIQRDLDFPGTVYGVSRDTPVMQRMQRQAEWYGAHSNDRLVDDSDRDVTP